MRLQILRVGGEGAASVIREAVTLCVAAGWQAQAIGAGNQRRQSAQAIGAGNRRWQLKDADAVKQIVPIRRWRSGLPIANTCVYREAGSPVAVASASEPGKFGVAALRDIGCRRALR